MYHFPFSLVVLILVYVKNSTNQFRPLFLNFDLNPDKALE